jgi:hypothetical protein
VRLSVLETLCETGLHHQQHTITPLPEKDAKKSPLIPPQTRVLEFELINSNDKPA